MPGHNNGKNPHRGGPIDVQHVIGQASLNAIRVVPSAYHMAIKFPTKKWGRKGPRRLADSPGMLLGVNEAESRGHNCMLPVLTQIGVVPRVRFAS